MQSLEGEQMTYSEQTVKSGSKVEEDQRLLVIADNDSCVSDENKEKCKRKLREKAKKEAENVNDEQSEHELDHAGS